MACIVSIHAVREIVNIDLPGLRLDSLENDQLPQNHQGDLAQQRC
jgi:hypothetical protein